MSERKRRSSVADAKWDLLELGEQATWTNLVAPVLAVAGIELAELFLNRQLYNASFSHRTQRLRATPESRSRFFLWRA